MLSCNAIITSGISTRGFSYGVMFIVGIFMGEKIPKQFSGGYFPGEVFIEPSQSFSDNANLSTKSKHIPRCKYKLFKLVQIINVIQIIQRSQNTFCILITNHLTFSKSWNNYTGFIIKVQWKTDIVDTTEIFQTVHCTIVLEICESKHLIFIYISSYYT